MALRCGCYDQADDLVFGPRHQCTSKPALVAAESVHADNISVELRRLEWPADECDGMDSPVDQLDLERRTNPYDMDDLERGGY